ncbi:MAG: aldehyde dehydrogenase family protein [Granulosicoccus sp.]
MTNTKTLNCISPVNGQVYATRETLSHAQAKVKVAAARRAQRHWQSLPLTTRIARVQRGIEQLGTRNDEIVTGLAWQMGRPVRYGGEYAGVVERSSRMAELAPEALSPLIVENSDAFERRIERQPRGLVLVIAPWNYPYMTAINTVVPALIAGNAVVLKHSTQTLLAGEHIEQAFTEAGVPEGVFQNVFLDHDLTRELLSVKTFDFVNFTGSVAGGRAVEAAAQGTFTSIALELGGKDPGYVMEDADIDVAAESLIDGAMFNSGQCCCGIERIYVAEALFDSFVDKAVTIVSGYKLGNPLDEEVTLGPMAHARFAATVRQQIKMAEDAGATGLIDSGLFAADDGGAYLSPQILTNVTHDMDIMREESFGPVVGIMKVSGDEEAITLMNDSHYGLTASLWTSDVERAARLGLEIDTGTVFMNRCDYLDPSLCWTGCKDTGRGEGLSVLGYHAVTRVKSYHLRKAIN